MNILPLIAMILVSLAIYVIVNQSQETTSGWVIRLRQITIKMTSYSPLKVGFVFTVFIFFELVTLIYLFKMYPWLIKMLYEVCIANVSFVALSLWFDRIFHGKIYTFIKIILSIALGVSWVYYPHWAVYNIVGVLGAVAFISLFPALDYARMTAIGVGIVIYDIVGVYVTGWIVDLVRGFTFTPPAAVMIPTQISANPHIMIIGLGDIIIGGLILNMAKKYSSYIEALFAYFISIIFSYLLAYTTKQPVPATIFIVPIMLLAVWLKSYILGLNLIKQPT